MERDCREFVRFGLLMRQIVLDWTLSRRWREDLGAQSRHGSSTPKKDESGICIKLTAEKWEIATGSKKKAEFLRCMLYNGMDVGFPSERRRNRETKLNERRWKVQFMTIRENKGEILVMLTWYDNLCYLCWLNLTKLSLPLWIQWKRWT